jgi:hypothetical protein
MGKFTPPGPVRPPLALHSPSVLRHARPCSHTGEKSTAFPRFGSYPENGLNPK